MPARRCVYKKLSSLKLAPGWRQRVKQDTIDEIAESMGRDGQITPLIAMRDGMVVDGEHRVLAARQAKLDTIECVIDSPARDVTHHEIKVLTSRIRRVHFAGDERDKAIARLVEIHVADDLVQRVPKPSGRPQTTGFDKVATGLGISRDAARQAVKRHRKRQAEPDREREPGDDDDVDGTVLDGRGQEIPAHLTARWKLHHDATDKIGKLFRSIHTEIGKMAADSGLNWTQELASSKNVWGSIHVRTPYAVCAWCKYGKPDCQTCHGYGFQSKGEQRDIPRELLVAMASP